MPPVTPRPAAQRQKALRITAVLRVCCFVFAGAFSAVAGCAAPQYAVLRDAPRNPLAETLHLTARRGPQPTDRTMQILRRYDLAGKLNGDQRQLLADFERVLQREPSPEVLYSFIELQYLAGKKTETKDEKQALDFFESAVAHAYLYLFDDQFGGRRNPYDPQFRRACDLYNNSLESALRIVNKQGKLVPGKTHTIESANRRCDVTVVVKGKHWRSEEIERFEFVSDYEVQGLTNQYQTFGLGVPLIAVRRKLEPASPTERFYPPALSFPATAFLRVEQPLGGSAAGQATPQKVWLELHDPLASSDIVVGGQRVPLESDLSTPLAYFLNDPQLNQLATYGLIRPDKTQELRGLYMLQPYEPGKIPVIMVHGLWSSPLTWVEMFNDLRSQREICEAYQFWFYFYPTGQPFWNSATQMRGDLAQVRTVLDPARREAALDQIVLIGHSMGGLVSKMQTVYSQDAYWRIVSDQPFQTVKATSEVKQGLEHLFFFEPNPSVRRVITIGTPHRGSKYANNAVRWLSHKLIYLPQMMVQGREQIVRDNPGLFRDTSLLQIKTSLDSLAPDSPVLPVLLGSPPAPWVKYHNVVGVLPNEGLIGKLAGGTDGVVSYDSAHLADAASELVVQADHSTVHRHPLTVLEIRRILLEHLVEIENSRPSPLPHVYTASASEQPLPPSSGQQTSPPWSVPFAPPPSPFPPAEGTAASHGQSWHDAASPTPHPSLLPLLNDPDWLFAPSDEFAR